MGMRTTTQSFQINQPYEQLFHAAASAVQAIDKATLTNADMNGRVVTFETPMGMFSWGERVVVGFIPVEEGTVLEITCSTKGLPNLPQDSRNRSMNARFITALSNLVQAPATEVARS